MRHLPEKLSLGLLLALLICLSSVGVQNAHARSLQPANPCQGTGHFSSSLSGVYTHYDTNSHCGGINAYVDTYISNCGSSFHDAESDT